MMHDRMNYHQQLGLNEKEWKHVNSILDNCRHAWFANPENKKYIVTDFRSIPLSTERIWSGTGKERKLRMNITNHVSSSKTIDEANIPKPCTWEVMWEVARTDVIPKTVGDAQMTGNGLSAAVAQLSLKYKGNQNQNSTPTGNQNKKNGMIIS